MTKEKTILVQKDHKKGTISASRKLRYVLFSAGLSTIPPEIFLPDNTHSFLLASVTPSTWLWYVSFALSHHVYFLLVAFNLNIIGILFLFAMLLVSLLPVSSKLKFYLLQSPYFPSLPLFILCLSLSPLKFLLISSPSSQWKLLYFYLSFRNLVGINFSFIILELVSVPLCVSPSLFWLSKQDVY